MLNLRGNSFSIQLGLTLLQLVAWDDGKIFQLLGGYWLSNTFRNRLSSIFSLICDSHGAQSFRAATIAHTRKCLIRDEQDLGPESATNSIIASFQPIGEAISKSCKTSKQPMIFSYRISRAYTVWQRRPRPSSMSYSSLLGWRVSNNEFRSAENS